MKYNEAMEIIDSVLTLTLDTEQPIEVFDFIGVFTSLATEYNRELKDNHPHLKNESKIFVKEVRSGSIVADLVPIISSALPVVQSMEMALILEDFVGRYARKIGGLINADPEPGLTKSELKTFFDTVRAVANDSGGTQKLEAARFRDGKRDITASFVFSTPEARQATKTIELCHDLIDQKENTNSTRVLMVFTRSDIKNASIGKRSGELVTIEEISQKSLALMYGSGLAEQRIKHEIREADENVYKKGFVVDVDVQYVQGIPKAYSVTNFHSVIDLPFD